MGGGGPDYPDQTTQTTEPPAYIKPYLSSAARSASQLGKYPLESYPNLTFVPQNAAQDMGAAMSLAYGTSPAMMGQIASGQAANQFMLNAPDVANNPYLNALKDMNQQRTMDAFQRNTLPGIADAAQATGGLGGSRQAIREGLAEGEVAKSLADYNAQVDARAYESGLGHQRYGLTALPQTMNLGYVPAQAYSAFGDYAARDPNMLLAEQMSKFDFAQQEPWDRLQRQMQIYAAMPGSTTTSSGMKYESNPLMGALGGGLMGYSLMGPVGSGLAGMGIGGSAMGPSAMLAGGMANPLFWPMILGGAALGSGIF